MARSPETLEVPATTAITHRHRYPLQGWVIGILSGAIALAALVIGSAYGNVHAKTLNPKLISWISTAVLVLFGIIATARLSTALSHLASRRASQSIEGVVKYTTAVVGYLFVAFSALAVLDVSVEHLLVGAGLAGVVLGIAGQQSLGNIFAGMVLIVARPFVVGDHIRIRSGALGGIFDAWVLEMSITYVTVLTNDGELKIPNTAMLAAGVGKLPSDSVGPTTAPASQAQPTPAQTTPAQTTPAQTTPAQTTPAPTTPAQPTPGLSAPAPPGPVSTDGGQAASAQATVPPRRRRGYRRSSPGSAQAPSAAPPPADGQDPQ